jgi:AcrR family transcriptional regulator
MVIRGARAQHPASSVDNVPTGRHDGFMDREITRKSPKVGARQKLLDATLALIRKKGYSSTSVDELCAQAGVTKGAFFHHFKSKDALAIAAASIDHLHRYIELLFQPTKRKGKETS